MNQTVTVRPFVVSDQGAVTAVQQALDQRSGAGQRATVIQEAGGRVMVVVVNDSVVGYGTAVPVPGLPQIFELGCGLLPSRRRQGLGSRLLAALITAAKAAGAAQLSYPVTDLESSGARFLRRRGFGIEHEEWQLELELDRPRPQLSLPPHCHLVTYERPVAVSLFRRLYEQSFQRTAWYQRYDRQEIETTLDQASDLLFYLDREEPIGFTWMHVTKNDVGELEPVGITPANQGQGHGRQLLLAALDRLAQRGVQRARVGVWRRNETAVQLYEQLGFRLVQTVTYLARDLSP